MIPLFHIPSYTVDTGKFTSLLHDVREFEERFADYVGAKYAVSFNSATSAIFLYFSQQIKGTVKIPSIIPPVVANAIINAGHSVKFEDNIEWVGNSYRLDHSLIDSAQKVEKDQFKKEAQPGDMMLFSFYPTKPVGSCDGGMIVSNDKEEIEKLRELSFNGMSQESNNWERKIKHVGHKMYMNSIQAYIANENLTRLEEKKFMLQTIRNIYNTEFGLKNTSDHLYRINVSDNKKFVEKAKSQGIVCGIHYDALHLNKIYGKGDILPESELESLRTVSIPFNEVLDYSQVSTVVEFVKKHQHENNA